MSLLSRRLNRAAVVFGKGNIAQEEVDVTVASEVKVNGATVAKVEGSPEIAAAVVEKAAETAQAQAAAAEVPATAGEAPAAAESPEALINGGDITETPADPAAAPGTDDAAAVTDAAPAEGETAAPAVDAPAGDAAADGVAAEVPAEGEGEAAAAAAAETPPAAEEPAAAAPTEGEGKTAADVGTGVDEEEVDKETQVSKEDLAVIETTGEEVAAELAGADMQAVEVGELVEEIGQAQNGAETLAALGEQVELSTQNGGMSEEMANVVQIATEHIYESLGMGKSLGIPAMESFAEAGLKRVSASQLALEDIKEKAQALGETILNGLKRAIAWIQEWAAKIFTANGRMKARAEQLIAAADQLSGNPGNASLEKHGNLAAKLALGNGIARDVAAEVSKANAFAGAVFADRTIFSIRDVVRGLNAANLAKARNDLAKGGLGTGGHNQLEPLLKGIQGLIGKGLKEFNGDRSKFSLPDPAEGTLLYTSPLFVGNATIWAQMPSSVDAMRHFRTGVARAEAGVSEGAKLAVLSADQIKAIGEAALEYVKVSEKYKEIQEATGTLGAAAVSVYTQVLAQNKQEEARGAVQEGAKEGVKYFAKMLGDLVRVCSALQSGVHQPAMAIAASANNAALDYAAASVAAYKKGGDTKALAAPAAA